MHSSPQGLTAQSKEQTERLTYNYDWFWTVIDLSYSFSKLERKVCPERPLVFMCLNSLLSQIKANLNYYTQCYSTKFHIFSRLWFDRSCNSWWRSPSTRTRARLSGGILSILSKFHWWNDRCQYLESRDSWPRNRTHVAVVPDRGGERVSMARLQGSRERFSEDN